MLDTIIEDFSFVVFDYTGYGLSDKDHCTLGQKEQFDLESVIEEVRRLYMFSHIYVWARSMGAVTALLLAIRSNNSSCLGMILDSPFSSTKEMVGSF